MKKLWLILIVVVLYFEVVIIADWHFQTNYTSTIPLEEAIVYSHVLGCGDICQVSNKEKKISATCGDFHFDRDGHVIKIEDADIREFEYHTAPDDSYQEIKYRYIDSKDKSEKHYIYRFDAGWNKRFLSGLPLCSTMAKGITIIEKYKDNENSPIINIGESKYFQTDRGILRKVPVKGENQEPEGIRYSGSEGYTEISWLQFCFDSEGNEYEFSMVTKPMKTEEGLLFMSGWRTGLGFSRYDISLSKLLSPNKWEFLEKYYIEEVKRTEKIIEYQVDEYWDE